MIADWRIREALAIQKLHGDDPASGTAERIDALVLAGDANGVERFTAVAVRLEQLLAAGRFPC